MLLTCIERCRRKYAGDFAYTTASTIEPVSIYLSRTPGRKQSTGTFSLPDDIASRAAASIRSIASPIHQSNRVLSDSANAFYSRQYKVFNQSIITMIIVNNSAVLPIGLGKFEFATHLRRWSVMEYTSTFSKYSSTFFLLGLLPKVVMILEYLHPCFGHGDAGFKGSTRRRKFGNYHARW